MPSLKTDASSPAQAGPTGLDRAFVLRHATAQLVFWSGFYYIFPALMPQIVQSTGWSELALSTALTMGFLLWAVLSPLAGACIDRGHGARAMLLAGLAGSALLGVLAMAPSQGVAMAAMVMLGVPMAMTLYDPCFALILRRFGPGDAGGRGVTRVTLIAGFATLVTFPSVAGLALLGVDWRWITAGFALAVLAAAALVPAEAAHHSPSPDRQARPDTPPDRRLLGLGVAFALVIFGHTVLLFQIPALLAAAWGGPAALLLPMVLGPAQVAGRLIWSAVQARVPAPTATAALFATLLLPPLLLLGSGGAPAVVVLALIVQGAGYGVQTILRPVLVAVWFTGAGFGRNLGIVAMIGLLLMAMGPVAGSAAARAGGLVGVLALTIGAVAAGLVLVLVLSRGRRDTWQRA